MTGLLLNIQCLISKQHSKKVEHLSDLAKENKIDFICLVETWLTPDILDAEICIQGYKIYRSDRKSDNNYPHGGAAIYLRGDYSVNSYSYSSGCIEIVICHLPQLDSAVISIYRPPTADISGFRLALKYVTDLVETFSSSCTIVLCGDFNYPPNVTEWFPSPELSYGLVPHQKSQSPSFEELEGFMIQHNLTQHVNQPTRKQNTLDLVFTNINCIRNIFVHPTPLSDHNLVLIETNIVSKTKDDITISKRTGISNFCFRDTDWPNVRSKISQFDFGPILHRGNLENSLSQIIDTLQNLCNSAGVRKYRNKPREVLIPRDRKTIFRRIQKINTRISKCQSDNIRNCLISKLKQAYDEIHMSIKKEHMANEAHVANKVKTNSKAFFAYANSKRKTNAKIGPLKDNNEIVSDPKLMANILKNQYKKVYVSSRPPKYIDNHKKGAPSIDEFTATIEDVVNAVKSLRATSAAGPDGVTPQFLKECVAELSPVLLELTQISFGTGNFPEALKHATITPIFKGGNASDPSNYRPISLVSCLGKVMEKIVQENLLTFCLQNDIIPVNQHGFRPSYSTTSELLQYIHDIIEMLEDNDAVEVVYLDYSKAFDKLDHGLLLERLQTIGIRNRALDWIESFLSNRTQRVRVGDCFGGVFRAQSGVPQGTVLGPILFILFTSPLLSLNLGSKLSSFADDTKVRCGNNTCQPSPAFQTDLNHIYNWSTTNGMVLNDKKFNLLQITKDLSNPINWSYMGSNHTPINQVNSVRDLGIIIESQGDFKVHIQTVYTKANQMSGWILRSFFTRDPIIMLTLFKSLVQPILDYASVVWSPTDATQLGKLEKVQRFFTRKLNGTVDLDYWQRLEQLRLYSIERRFERYITLHTFKIINNYAPNPGIC